MDPGRRHECRQSCNSTSPCDLNPSYPPTCFPPPPFPGRPQLPSCTDFSPQIILIIYRWKLDCIISAGTDFSLLRIYRFFISSLVLLPTVLHPSMFCVSHAAMALMLHIDQWATPTNVSTERVHNERFADEVTGTVDLQLRYIAQDLLESGKT